MKVYEAIFEEGKTEGVYALSVVENPAMQDMWITLSEQPQVIELAEVDNDKRLLLGAALIPNKKVYRKVNDYEFFLTFSEDTIEQVAHDFMKKQNNNNSSLEHEVKLEGMSVVEAWIVNDPNNDKSNLYGKTYDKGTWVTMMKVDNDDIWQKAKNGEIKGFSIDALLGIKEINFKNQIEMNDEAKKSLKDDILDGIKALFQSQEKEVVKEEVEQVEVQSEEVTEEVEENTDRDFDVEAFKKEMIDTINAEFKAQLEEVNKKHKEAIEAKDAEMETLKTELSKQPEVAPIKAKPEAKKETVQFASNRPRTTADRVRENLSKTVWN